jgi:hypothetical protein
MSSRDLKGSGLTDRLSAAADAKAALIAKMKPKATVTDPLFEERAAMREAELQAVREARAVEKAAAVQATADVQAGVAAAEEAALAEKRGARKERKQLTKAEAQQKRDARYAARKAR